jgi:hypothetical protein
MSKRNKIASVNWSAVKAEIHAILVEVAKAGQTITYSELTSMLQTAYVHYHSQVLVQLLTDIGRDEHLAGRPVLPALVVTKQTGMPGGGYFRFGPADDEMNDPAAAWAEDVKQVHTYWSQH